MVPKHWSTPPEPPTDTCHTIGGMEPSIWYDNSLAIFLDGFAGRESRDPRFRRLERSWWQWFSPPHDSCRPAIDCDDVGQYGIMSGAQSVPRAELQALIAIVNSG